MNVIETNGLSKAFGSKMAVDQFDMHVGQGDIYGCVGRNGAGKSTVMRMLAGLAAPTGGEVRVFGMQPREASASRRIGALIESPGLYGSMSATDNLMMKALALGLADPKDKVRDLLDLTGLGSVGSKATKNFSMGMKQRLGLALALLGSPDLLLLDEPLNGLDPEGAREIRRLIMRLNDERGITVVVSSHVLEQLGKMATRAGIGIGILLASGLVTLGIQGLGMLIPSLSFLADYTLSSCMGSLSLGLGGPLGAEHIALVGTAFIAVAGALCALVLKRKDV